MICRQTFIQEHKTATAERKYHLHPDPGKYPFFGEDFEKIDDFLLHYSPDSCHVHIFTLIEQKFTSDSNESTAATPTRHSIQQGMQEYSVSPSNGTGIYQSSSGGSPGLHLVPGHT